MPRRGATITLADAVRVIRAAKRAFGEKRSIRIEFDGAKLVVEEVSEERVTSKGDKVRPFRL